MDTPLFVDPDNLDLHILASSPAVDIGMDISAPSENNKDNTRLSGAGFDIGIDEY